jgi:hypothetical protein
MSRRKNLDIESTTSSAISRTPSLAAEDHAIAVQEPEQDSTSHEVTNTADHAHVTPGSAQRCASASSGLH